MSRMTLVHVCMTHMYDSYDSYDLTPSLASMASTLASMASGMSTSTPALPGINGVNTAFLASLLLIFKLGRSVDSGNLLGEITACTDKVAWILLVNHDLGGQKLAVLALNCLK